MSPSLYRGGASVFARTFCHAWGESPSPEVVARLCAEVAASLDWCLEAGLKVPGEIALPGEGASGPRLADALSRHLGLPCRLAGLPPRLRGRHPVPPEGIGALAAALS